MLLLFLFFYEVNEIQIIFIFRFRNGVFAKIWRPSYFVNEKRGQEKRERKDCSKNRIFVLFYGKETKEYFLFG